jgi:hypothetical protein
MKVFIRRLSPWQNPVCPNCKEPATHEILVSKRSAIPGAPCCLKGACITAATREARSRWEARLEAVRQETIANIAFVFG